MDIRNIQTEYCTGCRACAFICPTGAILFIKNEDGFYFPNIDISKCIDCGLCFKKCPVNNDLFNNAIGYSSFLVNKSSNILKQSTSGGVFYEYAEYIISHNGVVIGCTIDEYLKCKHIVIDNLNDIYKVQGSKYVESDFSIYFYISENLKKDKLILVSGTPCQIAGIKSIFGDQEKLFTIELICHGVPSSSFFERYCEYLSAKYKITIKDIKFRDKKYVGWGCGAGLRVISDSKSFTIEGVMDPYYQSFLKGMTLRLSCYKCKYKKMHRIADITIGDGWGFKKIYTYLNDANGASLSIINTLKGYSLFNCIKERFNAYNIPIEMCSYINPSLTRPALMPEIRKTIFNGLNTTKHFVFFSKIPVSSSLYARMTFLKRQFFKFIPFPLKSILRTFLAWFMK